MEIKKQTPGILRIGTSGIAMPGTKLTFPIEYQAKSRLHYYSTIFNTIEINSTFYKVPMNATFEKWRQDVPEDFQFTIKLWREITHVKELKFDPGNIDIFLKAADHTGNKKGCMLVQFPGKISLEYYNELETILQRLTEGNNKIKWRYAIEFRSPTWYVSETFELLDEYGASMVLHDKAKAKNEDFNRAANFIYMRFHGPEGNYRGSYGDKQLDEQSGKIREWLKSGKDVYAYFNNTMGNAFENAMTLKQLVG